jgi:hypothetical protein
MGMFSRGCEDVPSGWEAIKADGPLVQVLEPFLEPHVAGGFGP